MRTLLCTVIMMAACGDNLPGLPEPAWCETNVSKVAGWLSVDVTASCEGEWELEYRLISSSAISIGQRDRPCGSVTHISVLLSNPGLADLKAYGALIGPTQRVDCERVRFDD